MLFWKVQKSQKNVYARFNCNIALAANAVLESTKKSKKCLHAVQLQYANYWEGYKIDKPLSALLLCRLIMSLAERLPSKFNIYPQSFASFFSTISQPWTLSVDIKAARRGLFTK